MSTLKRDGIVILKTPIGTDEFCNAYLEDVVHKHERAVEQIIRTKPHNALRLLRFCFIPRMQYLARTVPPPLLKQHAPKFDSLVRSAFLTISGISDEEMTPRAETLLHARFCQGGLALRSLQLVSPLAYFSSLVASRNGLTRNNPHLSLNFSSDNPSPSSRILLDAHRYVSNAFDDHICSSNDLSVALNDIFPEDPTRVFSFYDSL